MMISDASPDDRRLATDLLETGLSSLDVSLAGDVSAVCRAPARFFARPEPEKLSASLDFDRGYLPFGREHSGDPSRPDQFEIFVASPRMAASAQGSPSEPARALHAAMMAVFDVLEARARGAAAAIAKAVGGGAAVEGMTGGFRS